MDEGEGRVGLPSKFLAYASTQRVACPQTREHGSHVLLGAGSRSQHKGRGDPAASPRLPGAGETLLSWAPHQPLTALSSRGQGGGERGLVGSQRPSLRPWNGDGRRSRGGEHTGWLRPAACPGQPSTWQICKMSEAQSKEPYAIPRPQAGVSRAPPCPQVN